MARRPSLRRAPYPGGKGKCFQHIINLMPPHDRYIETHLGAGSVMRNKRPALVNIGIELDERVATMWQAAPLPCVEVIHGDAVKVLSALGSREGDLVYSDPPYVPASRRRETVYRHDYDNADHICLLRLLKSLPCHVVLSGYPSELYASELAGWWKVEFQAQTQAGPANETIWTNFQPGPVLHDYAHVGAGFRERERLRRRIRTLSTKLATASPIERNAALAALADAQPGVIKAAAERVR